MGMREELDRAALALASARSMLDSLDYATERVPIGGVKFARSSDGVWWWRITTERQYMLEGLLGVKGTKFETGEQILAGRRDSAMGYLLAAYGKALENHAKGIKD